jgi:hypothetical protein
VGTPPGLVRVAASNTFRLLYGGSSMATGCVNAAHAQYVEVLRLLLIGRLDHAEPTLAEFDPTPLPNRQGPPTSLYKLICGDRATPSDKGGARWARSGRADTRPYPCTDSAAPKRRARPAQGGLARNASGFVRAARALGEAWPWHASRGGVDAGRREREKPRVCAGAAPRVRGGWRPLEKQHAAVLAFLADGESCSSSGACARRTASAP